MVQSCDAESFSPVFPHACLEMGIVWLAVNNLDHGPLPSSLLLCAREQGTICAQSKHSCMPPPVHVTLNTAYLILPTAIVLEILKGSCTS